MSSDPRSLFDGKKFLKDAKTVAVVCDQFGDTGKGKIVDLLSASWADIVVRGTGGGNAGHTISVGTEKHVLHLVPCGILHEQAMNVIGSGVALDPKTFLDEVDVLSRAKISVNKLAVSSLAHLVLPYHIALDRVREASLGTGKIGTTGRGIGPTYTDFVNRTGLVANDLLNPDVFRKKLAKAIDESVRILRTYDPAVVREVMRQEILGRGAFYKDEKIIFDVPAIVAQYEKYGSALREFVRDTDALVREAVGKKNILLEGAQGHLLSLRYGTHPFVTSSDCSVGGLAEGSGMSVRDVDFALGLVKAPFMTRVGEGPFPTELGGEGAAVHCRNATRETEAKEYPNPSLNDKDDLIRGIAVRKVGNEYGATTGRARRTGWLDLPMLRYAARTNGPNVVLTKVDIADGTDVLKICESYIYDGEPYEWGGHKYQKGDALQVAVPDLYIMEHVRPQYTEIKGWKGPIGDIRTFDDLPKEVKNMVALLEKRAGVNVSLISVGPDREATVAGNPPRKA